MSKSEQKSSSDVNLLCFWCLHFGNKMLLQISEYWLHKILKPTELVGLGLSNFCCLCNFSPTRHRKVIYLKKLWPNLAGNAVCQCLQMYCFCLQLCAVCGLRNTNTRQKCQFCSDFFPVFLELLWLCPHFIKLCVWTVFISWKVDIITHVLDK